MSTSSTLLLCIDLQPGFLKAIPVGAEVLRRASFAVEAARGLEIPILFTEQVPAKLGGTAPELLALAGGAPALGKDSFSAFADDAIAAHIADLGVEHLLICGIETPVCVYQTSLDARRLDYQVTLLTDAVGARRPDDAGAVLAELIRAGCHALPSESVFYALLHDAQHPFFRAYTSLVKKYG